MPLHAAMHEGGSKGRFFAFLLMALPWAGLAAAKVTSAIDFTPEERRWMADHPVIRVGHDPTYAPYSFWNAQGRLVGIDLTYLEILAQRTGLQFVNEIQPSWAQTMEDFRSHKIDLLLSLGHTPERETYISFTEPYSFSPDVLVIREDAGFLFSPSELNARTVAAPRDYTGLQRDLLEVAPQARIVEYDNMTETLKAVSRGDVEAAISDLAVSSYLVKALHLDNVRIGGVFAEASGNYIGIRKDWPELVSILNKVLHSIPPEERRQINNRWVAMEQPANPRWILAFKLAAALAGFAIVIFLLVFLHNRQLSRELAQRRRIQEELELTRDRLARISEEKSNIVNMVAHDLRSPLTGIMLGADFLGHLPGDLPPQVRDAAERIKEGAEQMTRLISDLLVVHKIEAGRLTLGFHPADAVMIVRNSLRTHATLAVHKDIRLESRLPAAPLETAPSALQQVVDNLLSNALKYSPAGSLVTVVVEPGPTHCRIVVRDEGPGVKSHELEQIFDQYGRGSARPTSGESSTGLGLWIVRRLVATLNGRVWCESVEGRGATFLVELPNEPGFALPSPEAAV
ncbi:MAG: ATP-binding protein [Opitutales bacterium]